MRLRVDNCSPSIFEYLPSKNNRKIVDSKWLEWAKITGDRAKRCRVYPKPFDIERYKSLSAITAEIMATYSNVEPSYVLDLFQREVGYATPKVDVRGAVFRGDTLLFVREREDGCWSLPGGWADVGDSPSEVAMREVYEESDIIHAVKLLAVYDRDRQGHPPFKLCLQAIFFSANS
jgi:hypothetical protein